MTTILDLPVHPLAVHVPIVLVGLLVLLGTVYVLVPPLRRLIGWIVTVLVLASPLLVYGTILTGEQLANYKYGGNWPQVVTDHRSYGYRLLWTLLGLVPVWFLFGALERGRRTAAKRNGEASAPASDEDGETASSSAGDPAATGRRIVMFILGLVALALLGIAAWLLFESGHTGAEMIWGGTVQA